MVPALTVEFMPLQLRVVASGEVRFQSLARIGSEITGTVTARHVREGDWVDEGDLLIELNAKTAFSHAGLIADSLATNSTEERLLQQRIDSAETELARTRLYAPFAGRVQTRNVEPGDLVQPGKVLLEIARSGSEGDVLIGRQLAGNLGLRAGDKLRLDAGDNRQAVMDVAGIFESGVRELDSRYVYTDIKQAQTLLNLPGGITILELKISDVFNAEYRAQRIKKLTGLLGLAGSLLGVMVGYTLVQVFNNFGERLFLIRLEPSMLISAMFITTTAGVIAAMVPARRAARYDPAVAIRYV